MRFLDKFTNREIAIFCVIFHLVNVPLAFIFLFCGMPLAAVGVITAGTIFIWGVWFYLNARQPHE